MIFSMEVLPASQTFVRDHVENVRAFDIVLAGARRVAGLDVDHLDTVVLPSSRLRRGLIWLFGHSPALDQVVRTRRVVAIHAHFADAGMKIAAYARRRGLPLIVTLHGADVLRTRSGSYLRRTVTSFLRRRMWKTAAQFLPVSEFIERAALKQGYPPERLHRHVLGIPLVEDSPAAEAGLEDREPPTILFIGRLVEKKGLRYLLEACAQLADAGCRFTLTVIGDGPLADRHRAEAKALGTRVHFLGTLPPEKVREEIGKAKIICMPSTMAADGDNEGLPIVCLEAQAAGVPLVAFDQGPVREGVIDGVTALLAPDKSAEGLAGAIRQLLDDPALRARMGSAGRAFVREHFDIRDRARELDALYLGVLEGSA